MYMLNIHSCNNLREEAENETNVANEVCEQKVQKAKFQNPIICKESIYGETKFFSFS